MTVSMVFGVLALFADPSGAVETVVTDVRVAPVDGVAGTRPGTRIVLEMTRKVDLRYFLLQTPDRLVIDLPVVGWRLPPRPLPINTGLLGRIRYGLFKPGVTRVVLDLTGPAQVSSAFTLSSEGGNGFRVVFDLFNVGRATFAADVSKPPVSIGARVASSAVVPAPVAKNPVRPQSVEPVRGALARGLLASWQPVKSTANGRVMQTALVFTAPLRKPFPVPLRRGSRPRIVAIDPGHGGADPGTIGISGVYEKHITLAFAREIKKRMEATGKYKVVLTRNRDVFVRLRDRVSVARDAGADLFISIHADSMKNPSIRGGSVYTLSEKASDKEAAALAEKENKVDLIAGVDLSHESSEVTNILIDLAQRETMNQSARFATSLTGELKRKTRLLRNTHRFAGFAVLKAPDVPSVLLELGFLSNREDERALRNRSHRVKIADVIVRAVGSFFDSVEEAQRK